MAPLGMGLWERLFELERAIRNCPLGAGCLEMDAGNAAIGGAFGKCAGAAR